MPQLILQHVQQSSDLEVRSLYPNSCSVENLSIDRFGIWSCGVHQQLRGLQELDEEDLDASFEQYCQNIQETAAWGGQTELNAVASVLQRHIKVYAAGLPVVDMGQQYAGDHTSVLVKLLHLTQCCDKYHYAAMRPGV